MGRTFAPTNLVAVLAMTTAAHAQAETATITTAPVYLPDWNQQSWSLVRGSIIDQDETASHTTYTIFCPEETPPACGLSLEFPFELVEGPDTVEFHGTYTSTYIVELGCSLEGRTSAECSGYSSYKSGYSNGFVTGPTEISWTKTLTGSDVEWGVLTMAAKPTHTDDFLEIDPDDLMQPSDGEDDEEEEEEEEGGGSGAASLIAPFILAGVTSIASIALAL